MCRNCCSLNESIQRGNFSAAAGFGFDHGRTGVFSTFSAFLEMCLSEITMARLNFCNVLCHFSHAGVDEIADNSQSKQNIPPAEKRPFLLIQLFCSVPLWDKRHVRRQRPS
jgi:hypothetical protein